MRVLELLLDPLDIYIEVALVGSILVVSILCRSCRLSRGWKDKACIKMTSTSWSVSVAGSKSLDDNYSLRLHFPW